MKKAVAIILCAGIGIFMTGCGLSERLKAGRQPQPTVAEDPFSQEMLGGGEPVREESREFVRAVWVSYLDLANVVTTDASAYSGALERMLDNLETLRCTDIYFQVRAFGDSLYPSEIFPSAGLTTYSLSAEVDYLALAVEKAHARGIRLHAWINPYRLSDTTNAEYQGFVDGLLARNADCVVALGDRRYLNPASETARELVLAGARELLENYEIDGIHLDDYFYPTTDASFDAAYYERYAAGGGTLALDAWRRGNVSALVQSLYDLTNEIRPSALLGISPDASIERDRSQHYVDVETFCAQPGYVDYICPQIYFGYSNQSLPFLPTVNRWAALCTACDLIVGLSFYKVGAPDQFAGTGSNEWLESTNIISRQYLDTLEITGCSGVAFFRYNSIFAPEEAVASVAAAERENLQNSI